MKPATVIRLLEPLLALLHAAILAAPAPRATAAALRALAAEAQRTAARLERGQP